MTSEPQPSVDVSASELSCLAERIQRVRANIESAFFTVQGDKQVAMGLYNKIIIDVSNAMVYSGEGMAQGYDGERNATGQREGRGTMRFANGEIYEGEWKEDKYEGRGIYRYPDGAVYDGEYVAGKKEGHGSYRFADGATYVGEYVAGKQEGCGKYRFANGNMYEGNFKANTMDGRGVYRYADGTEYDGEFKANEMVRVNCV